MFVISISTGELHVTAICFVFLIRDRLTSLEAIFVLNSLEARDLSILYYAMLAQMREYREKKSPHSLSKYVQNLNVELVEFIIYGYF